MPQTVQAALEQRNWMATGLEIRKKEAGGNMITGYAVKWEELSLQMGNWYRFRERFRKGAFTDSLGTDDQRALWSHDTSQVLGRRKNNTLRLEEDDIGLRFEIDLPDTTLGKDAHESIRRGDVDGVSFGFRMNKEEWDETDPTNIIRTVLRANLIEVSPVAFPAYEGSSEVSTRSQDEPYTRYRELSTKEKTEQAKPDLLRKRLDMKTRF